MKRAVYTRSAGMFDFLVGDPKPVDVEFVEFKDDGKILIREPVRPDSIMGIIARTRGWPAPEPVYRTVPPGTVRIIDAPERLRCSYCERLIANEGLWLHRSGMIVVLAGCRHANGNAVIACSIDCATSFHTSQHKLHDDPEARELHARRVRNLNIFDASYVHGVIDGEAVAIVITGEPPSA